MKIVLIVLLFCFFINLTSAFLWFSSQLNQQSKQITESSSTHRPTSYFQQENQSHNATNSLHQTITSSNKNKTNYLSRQRFINWHHNTTALQHQADSINKNSSQIIPYNRFQAIEYQQQRSSNNSLVFRQTNRVINNTKNRITHPRYRPFRPIVKNKTTIVNPAKHRVSPSVSLKKSVIADSQSNSSSIIKNNIQPSYLRSAVAKAIDNNGSQDRQRLLDNFHHRQRLKALYQRINKKNATRTHSNFNQTLRK